jgi:hypothetical protein
LLSGAERRGRGGFLAGAHERRHDQSGRGEQTTITGTVALTEDLGASLLVHFDVPVPPPLLDGDGIAVDDDLIDFAHRTDRSRLRATVDGFASVHAGDSVPIAINLDRMHHFDRHTRLAIGAQPH